MPRSNHRAVIHPRRGVTPSPPPSLPVLPPSSPSLPALLVFEVRVMSGMPPAPPPALGGRRVKQQWPPLYFPPLQPWKGGGSGQGAGLKTASTHSRLCQAATCSWRRRHRPQIPASVTPTPTQTHTPQPPPPHLAETRMTSCCITNGPEPQRLLSSSHCERQESGGGERKTMMTTQKHNCCR